ncbi:MAG: glycine cleavage system protein GcvH [Archangium gephyra]|uniref:Glycine cleavage system H protein n=1 Tax=Archangium gephyra TaxID=48 RepID=A0A2W5TH53_9BACT|nr:MAG: glycine cleavage system protein GcvH [Archangium gephyra]
MSNYPSDLKYTKDHEWAKKAGNAVVVGVTWHAQDALGAVVYVELPKLGATVKAHESFGVIESTKAVSELYAPLSGKVVKVNDAVVDAPGTVNDDPYAAWLIEIEPENAAEFDGLLDQATYVKSLS